MTIKKILIIGILYCIAAYLFLLIHSSITYGFTNIENAWLILLVFVICTAYLIFELAGVTKRMIPIQAFVIAYFLLFSINIFLGKTFAGAAGVPLSETITLMIVKLRISNLLYSGSVVLVICTLIAIYIKIKNGIMLKKS